VRLALLLVCSGAIYGQRLAPAEFRALGKACIPQSDRLIVTAIVRTESAFNPWALSLNYPKTLARKAGLPPGRVYLAHQPRSRSEAIRWAKQLLTQRMTLSVGLMQVNVEQGYTVERLLDPCENLRIGWRLLIEKYGRAMERTKNPDQSIRMALSDYNTGSQLAGQQNGYAGRVLLNVGGR
jgi:type IV secretion system protein VirB1